MSAVPVEPAPVVPVAGELIPLSHLALDLPEPREGWAAFLGRRAIPIRPDAIGRDSITVHAARLLLEEKRADELRLRKLRAVLEEEAMEADRLRRAQMPKGIPAGLIPEGVPYLQAVRQAELDALPRRRSMLEEALSDSTLTYHSLQDEGA